MKSVRRSAIRLLLLDSLVLMLMTHACLAIEVDGSDWRTFESAAGRFSVDMPAAPLEETKGKRFLIANFVSRVYKAFVGDDTFGVNHTDLPRVVMIFATKNKIFRSTRDGFLEDSNARELSFDEVQATGRAARKLIYEIPRLEGKTPLLGKAIMLFEGNRLYIFFVEATEERAESDLQRFFGSIEISKEPE